MSYLERCEIMKKNFKDKLVIVDNAIQYLDQKTKNELIFMGFIDRVDLIIQTKKVTSQYAMLKW